MTQPQDFDINNLVIKDITKKQTTDASGKSITIQRLPLKYLVDGTEQPLSILTPALTSTYGITKDKGKWENHQIAFNINKSDPEQEQFINIMDQITDAIRTHLIDKMSSRDRPQIQGMHWTWVSKTDTEEKRPLIFTRVRSKYVTEENKEQAGISSKFYDEAKLNEVTIDDMGLETLQRCLIDPETLKGVGFGAYIELILDYVALNRFTIQYKMMDARVDKLIPQQQSNILKFKTFSTSKPPILRKKILKLQDSDSE